LSTEDNEKSLEEIREKIEGAEVSVKGDTIHLKVASSDAFISSFIKRWIYR